VQHWTDRFPFEMTEASPFLHYVRDSGGVASCTGCIVIRASGLILGCSLSSAIDSVVHTHVHLSSSSIIWYWPKVSDALWLVS